MVTVVGVGRALVGRRQRVPGRLTGDERAGLGHLGDGHVGAGINRDPGRGDIVEQVGVSALATIRPPC